MTAASTTSRRLVRRLYAGAIAAGVLAGLAAGAGGDLATTALQPFAIWALLLAATLATIARTGSLRSSAARSPDADPGAEAEPTAKTERSTFILSSSGLALACVGTLALLLALSLAAKAAVPPAPGNATIVAALALAVVGFASFAAARWTAAASATLLPEAPGLTGWLQGAQWISLLTAAGLAARGLGLPVLDADRWLTTMLLVFCAVCAAELAGRGALRLLTSPGRVAPVAPIGLMTLDVVFHPRGPISGAADVVERELGLSLRSAWALGFVIRRLPPVVLAMGVLLWLSTALVVVAPDEQGVRLRFGRLASPDPVEPGLHVTWPWPIAAIERYPVRRTQTLPLGYAGPQRSSLLWAETHAREEYTLLLGDGRELVSVDAAVTYRIRDVVRYALVSQNARDVLAAIAYRLLMQVTVTSNLDRLLSVDRGRFARQFAERLQQEVDARRLGLEILHTGFTSLHPPVGVAPDYQAVVSAEVARRTIVARAQEDRERTLPAAAAEAEAEVMTAQAAAALGLADAAGGASAFMAALGQYKVAPDLFTFRRRLEALEDGAAGLGLFVVDRRVAVESRELWIDLRPGASASGGVR